MCLPRPPQRWYCPQGNRDGPVRSIGRVRVALAEMDAMTFFGPSSSAPMA
jgi:hypothetical protein